MHSHYNNNSLDMNWYRLCTEIKFNECTVVLAKFRSMSPSLSPTGVPSLGLRLVSTSTHDCLDWTLTYECTVMGYLSGTIVWTGTAPNCPNDEMLLVHRYFPHQDVIFESCNGTIVAQSLSVQDNLYTSQLSVTVTHEAAGKTIMCFYDDDIITNASQFSTQIPGIKRAVIHVCTLP